MTGNRVALHNRQGHNRKRTTTPCENRREIKEGGHILSVQKMYMLSLYININFQRKTIKIHTFGLFGPERSGFFFLSLCEEFILHLGHKLNLYKVLQHVHLNRQAETDRQG